MYCRKCGKELPAGVRFCTACGTPCDGNETFANTAPDSAPILGKRRKGAGLAIGIGAAAVVALICVVVLGLRLMGGAKVQAGRAAWKSIHAYTGIYEAICPYEWQQPLSQKTAYSGDCSVEVLRLSDELGIDAFRGLRVGAAMDTDMSQKQLDLSLRVGYGSANLATGVLSARDDVVSIYSPEFFDRTAYGVNTRTLGKDLRKLDADEAYTSLSFNLFDAAEQLSPYVQRPQIDSKELRKVADQISVEKVGSTSVSVNGSSQKCKQYHVTIPKDAMLDLAAAVKDAYQARNFTAGLVEVLRGAGVSKDVTDEIKSLDTLNDAYGSIRDTIKELGDTELELYIKNGYIMGVEWEDKFDGERVSVNAYLGGGKEYVDDLSVELKVGSDKAVFESSGNHSGSGGTYTDSTSLRSSGSTLFTSEAEYNPSSGAFSWTGKADTFTLRTEGTMHIEKKQLQLQLDEFAFIESGDTLLSLRADYSLSPYAGSRSSQADKVVMLLSLSSEELQDVAADIEYNAEQWYGGQAGDAADLLDYLWWYVL